MIRRATVACLVLFACLTLAATAPALAVGTDGELTLSASLFNAKQGATVYAAKGEYLHAFGDYLYAGLSVSLYDAGETDGGAFGVAGEIHMSGSGKCGPGFGAALYRPTGDAADLADYTGELRAFFECGDQAFVKVMATQTWSQQADGARKDPDGTAVLAGIGWRFGK